MYIQTNDLVKTYNGRNVVNGVSIRVDLRFFPCSQG